MKKSKFIWLLCLWFVYVLFLDIENIYDIVTNKYIHSIDYLVYSYLNITVLYFIFTFWLFFINTIALYYLLKPNLFDIKIIFLAFFTGWTYNAITMYLSLTNIEILRVRLIATENISNIDEKVIVSFLFSQEGFIALSMITLMFYMILSFLLYKNKKIQTKNSATC